MSISPGFKTHLEKLYLAYNRLLHANLLLLDIQALRHLKILDVQSQIGNIIDLDKFHSMFPTHGGRPLHLVGRRILTALNTYNNDDFIIKLICPNTLQSLNLECASNMNLYFMPGIMFVGKMSLKYLNLAQNKLEKILGPVYITSPPTDLIVLDLSKNDCEYMHPGAWE